MNYQVIISSSGLSTNDLLLSNELEEEAMTFDLLFGDIVKCKPLAYEVTNKNEDKVRSQT